MDCPRLTRPLYLHFILIKYNFLEMRSFHGAKIKKFLFQVLFLPFLFFCLLGHLTDNLTRTIVDIWPTTTYLILFTQSLNNNPLCKYLILTCLPLVAMLRSPHLNVHDFTEKPKRFYCPSGYRFWTKSSDLEKKTRKICYLNYNNCSWSTSDKCSVPLPYLTYMMKLVVNRYFEVIIINLYSSEQKYEPFKISTMYLACEYCEFFQPYKYVPTFICMHSRFSNQ